MGELVVLGDVGPGETKAREAVQASRAHLALPTFAKEERIDDKLPTDFNDMAVLSSFASVGDRLREIVYRDKQPLPTAPGLAADLEMGAVPGERKEEVMGNVKEKLVTEAQEPSRRGGSKRSEPKQGTPQESSAPTTASVSPEPPATTTPADDASAVPSRQFAPTRAPVGEPLLTVADVPSEVKALAEHRFGSPLRMGTPRENGGPYRGEVFNTEHYLIQEVATRSVVFHPKVQMEFVSERLRWMNENARLNGAELQVGYDGDRPKVYPWDRARDLLERAVGSLKKSARELNFSPNLEVMLDQLQTRSWTRVREARAAALEQSKERTASQDSPGPDR